MQKWTDVSVADAQPMSILKVFAIIYTLLILFNVIALGALYFFYRY